MDASLKLSDVLKRNLLEEELKSKKVRLVRHSLNDPLVKECVERNLLEEYQKVQKTGAFKKGDYIISFISESGTRARLYGCYYVNDIFEPDGSRKPENFPDLKDGSNFFTQDNTKYYDLKKTDKLSDLNNRLIIDWGKGTLSWLQYAYDDDRDKPILAIQEKRLEKFPGYENVILSYDDLKKIVKDAEGHYEDWHIALKSVYAIYLIVDTKTGKTYVGSAYGRDGLLERWTCYANTKHGGNKGMKEVLCNYPERYKYFQFSILRILPKSISIDEVIEFENLYKRKLLSIKFGMNEN